LGDEIEGKESLQRELSLEDEPLWVAGGTGPGEEQIILETLQRLRSNSITKNLRVAIIPRKPERFNEVAKLISIAGFEVQRYSEIKGRENTKIKKDAVILGDTMGDLRKFYALSDCVFVGRTLTPMGGSDMMESTAMGKLTTFGPHTFNFKQTVDVLLKASGAVEVQNSDELFEVTLKCFSDPNYRDSIAANGRKVIEENQGATKRTITEIAKLLQK